MHREAITHQSKLAVWDWLVIAGYFLIIGGIGFWSSIKTSKNSSVSGYFLAGRNTHWILVGTSLFASNIGSNHFIGLAGSGSLSGIAISAFELNVTFLIIALGWIYVPIYFSSGVYTMPEYIQKRFGGQRIRVYLAFLSIILYIFTKISVDLYAGAIFIKQSMNLDLYFSVGILLAISGIFTISGGLTAVIWTELMQTTLMLAGALTVMILSLAEVGGYYKLMEEFPKAVPHNKSFISLDQNNVSCSKVTEYYKNLFRPLDDENMPWIGMIFGGLLLCFWYWCTDQVIVQRALAAKDVSHAKAGCIMTGLLKITPLYLLVIPGMAARVLWPDEIACSNPEKCNEICGNRAGCSNIAYPMLVLNLMPPGASGLMMSVMMAALMSSLSSIFNSSSTIFTIDIYSRIRKSSSEIEQVIVGRIFVVILVVVSIIWLPFIDGMQGNQLFNYTYSVIFYLVPPICSLFLLAAFWHRVTEPGAFWGLVIGFLVGISRFITDFFYHVPTCGLHEPDDRPAFWSTLHYSHFGCLLFVISFSVMIVVSFLTKPIEEECLPRMSFWTRFSSKVRREIHRKSLEMNQLELVYYIQTKDGRKTENTATDPNKHESGDYLKWLYLLCCISNNKSESGQTEQLSKEQEAVAGIERVKENQSMARLCNILGAITFVVGIVVFGLNF